MAARPFPSPVRVQIDPTSEYVVASAWEAIECLQKFWPSEHGGAYRRAYQACLDAVDGWLPAHQARKAFVAAAREAGLLPKQKSEG